MLNKVVKFIKDNNLIKDNDIIVVGVSGGADSVSLFLMLLEIKKVIPIELFVVHINHGIRGDEADQDALFVEKLCDKFDTKFQIFKFNIPKIAKQRGISLEEAGREVRYETFFKVVTEKYANKIAVAHNLNDNAETILLSLFRGTGLKGLTGIKAKRDIIIRPLLCLSRKEIENYLNENHVSYRTDSTNLEDVYIRNIIRNTILPEVTKVINAGAVSHIVNAGATLEEIENYLEEQTHKEYEGTTINLEKLLKMNIVIRKRIIRKAIEEAAGKLKDITAVHVQDVLSLCEKSVGKFIMLPYGIRAVRTYDSIIIEEDKEDVDLHIVYLQLKEGEYILPYERGKLAVSFNETSENLENEENMYTKCFDYDKIKGALYLRTRREGDFIKINPNGNTKKIKTYFIDEKIPSKERDNILLVTNENHVLWIVGHRVSEEFRVTNDTKTIIKLEYHRGQDER